MNEIFFPRSIMSRCSDYVNKKTQEEAVGMIVVKGARYPRGMEFVTIFADGAAYLATLDLRATDFRVLLALIAGLAWENFIRVSQKKLAAQLGLAPSNVSASIRRLIHLGLIAKQPDPLDDERLLLRLSLNLAWRGRPKAWVVAVNSGETIGFAPVPLKAGGGRTTKRQTKARKRSENSMDTDASFEADRAA
jgi:hypothetical protein